MNVRNGLLVLGTAALLTSFASAQRGGPRGPVGLGKDRPEILRKMLQAFRDLRYSGTRLVEFRTGAERDSHLEFVLKSGPFTRIEFPRTEPQAGQIIIETLQDRFHYFPDSNEIHVLPPRREEALGRLGDLLRGGIRAQESDGEKIAGYPTSLVTLSDPRGNPIQKLWIFPRNGMLLKRELYDPLGARVGFFEYREVNFDPLVRPEDFRPARRGAKMVYPKDLLRRIAKENGFEAWTLAEDADTRLDNSRLVRVEGNAVLAQTYQSPRGPLSLFQTKAKMEAGRFRQLAKRQGWSAFVWQNNGLTFALIGNLPEDELERLSRTVAARD